MYSPTFVRYDTGSGENEKVGHRREGDFIRLKNLGGYTDRWTNTDGYRDNKVIP
jgi:hypothetical protein